MSVETRRKTLHIVADVKLIYLHHKTKKQSAFNRTNALFNVNKNASDSLKIGKRLDCG